MAQGNSSDDAAEATEVVQIISSFSNHDSIQNLLGSPHQVPYSGLRLGIGTEIRRKVTVDRRRFSLSVGGTPKIIQNLVLTVMWTAPTLSITRSESAHMKKVLFSFNHTGDSRRTGRYWLMWPRCTSAGPRWSHWRLIMTTFEAARPRMEVGPPT